jgi:spermidine synthase
LAIGLVSAGVLGYEVLLARLFSIIQWHHFAYMIISVALLGFGASGTAIALLENRLRPRAVSIFAASAAAFGIAAVGCFAIAERLPFNPLELIWDPRQTLYLLALYALLTVPFFFGGLCIGLALARFPEPVGRIYGVDLLGAGAGALGMVFLLFLVFPSQALELIGALGLLAAAAASLSRSVLSTGGYALAAGLVALALPASWTALQISPYKSLSQALELPGARIETERSSSLGLVSAVRSPQIPFRHVPGLSLTSTAEPPEQIGLFVDGEGPSPITAFDGDFEPLAYLDLTTQALPYGLLRAPEVLILGAGGGAPVLLALYHSASAIDAVELDPALVRLVRERYGDFGGRILERPEVRVHVAEARGFAAGSDRRYDMIQLPLLDSFAAAGAGNVSLHESFVYTVEAFEAYLDRLEPGGFLAITRWLKLPPRDSLKLFLTARRALERRGVDRPERHLALIRSWDTTTLLVGNRPLDDAQIEAIRDFAERRSFDLAWLPGMGPDEANRFNLLEQPYFFAATTALSGDYLESFVAEYKFDLAPATDDRPYFFDFFRWQSLPELLALAGQSGAVLLDWGYLILIVTLAQAALLSVLLVLLPLWLASRGEARGHLSRDVVLFFGAIGLAFLMVEIAFIQKLTLLLHHPLYAIGVVLAGFLVFAGLGSGAAATLEKRLAARGDALGRWQPGAIVLAVVAIAAIATVYVIVLPGTFRALAWLPDLARITLALLLIAPLAFFMGMPFPLALSRLRERAPELVPWAWGINGCASVISAILATLLAITFGTSVVVLLAVALYLAAGLVSPLKGALPAGST